MVLRTFNFWGFCGPYRDFPYYYMMSKTGIQQFFVSLLDLGNGNLVFQSSKRQIYHLYKMITRISTKLAGTSTTRAKIEKKHKASRPNRRHRLQKL